MPSLPAGPFRVADALAEGIRRETLRTPLLEAPFHGVRAPAATWSDFGTRCRAYATKMRPDAAFTSVTAARLWGAPLPVRLLAGPVHVSVPHGNPRPRGRGVLGSQRSPAIPVVHADGLRVLSPPAAWASLAPVLSVEDLVAVGDFLVTGSTIGGRGIATLDELADVIGTQRWSGIEKLRQAAGLVRIGSLSRPESLLRLVAHAAGAPEPAINSYIHELRAAPDLAWPEGRFGVEYEGDHHRAPVQFMHDISRVERIHDHGWHVMRVSRRDLFDDTEVLAQRIRSRLAERGIPLDRFRRAWLFRPLR